MSFTKAIRSKTKLRMAIDGPSGSGKTFTGLRFAFALAGETGRVAVICSENGSAAKYQGEAPDGVPWNFDILVLKNYAPTSYTEAIKEAGRGGYDVLLVDSLSHAWSGSGGALEIKDAKGGNSFTAWKDVTPMHNLMIEAILTSPIHIIATMRSKTEYILEGNENGKQVPKKVGLAPVQRAGMEYEFDVYGSMDLETHTLRITKSRCRAVDGAIAVRPEGSFMKPIADWLNSGEPTAAGPSLKDQMISRLNAAADMAALNAAIGLASSVKKEMTAADWKEIEGTIKARRVKLTAPPPSLVNGQPTAQTPPPAAAPAPESPPPEMIRPDQLEELRVLRGHYFLNLKIEGDLAQANQWAALLAPHGVTTAKALTAAAADRVLMEVRRGIPFPSPQPAAGAATNTTGSSGP